MANKEATFEEICRDVKNKKFAPVYVLMGDEAYFIDRMEELIVENALDDSARDFNQTIFYGADSNVENIINAALRFPIMSERQLVVVKEAQELNKIDLLSHYVDKCVPTTILIICHKYKTLDKRKKLLTSAKKAGIVFESKKLYPEKMPDFIVSFMKRHSLETDRKSAQMLADYIGNDIGRLARETEKLRIITDKSASKRITPELIEKNIGVSKEYNSFEFRNAIASKDALKANKIAIYFDKNKNNAIQGVLPILFDYFVNLMICKYAQDRTENDVARTLGSPSWTSQVKDCVTGIRNFTAMEVYNAIHEIRLADAKSKGFEFNSSSSDGEIYKELLCHLLRPRT
ncbi:MAG: DNA polymerase III subunit delta [Tannerella sp.]|jgi:DNA polymerase-3 subunit delta|nr:DNA polymerase III subunit delta [Tannerella sp.]